ncbi:hypothetical protein M0811_12375 [Anaeramoeba ignava]|uniref:Uncharacterized protein n=1 Tax=Anaeramoeba ignava TaxID=1746090 RepID=A0A9Q0R711_ANAIG|nr:hypothetical protein M0811_12375 [Anaeramoeba ignava]
MFSIFPFLKTSIKKTFQPNILNKKCYKIIFIGTENLENEDPKLHFVKIPDSCFTNLLEIFNEIIKDLDEIKTKYENELKNNPKSLKENQLLLYSSNYEILNGILICFLLFRMDFTIEQILNNFSVDFIVSNSFLFNQILQIEKIVRNQNSITYDDILEHIQEKNSKKWKSVKMKLN